jgi:outer membrane protein assembly factor BamE
MALVSRLSVRLCAGVSGLLALLGCTSTPNDRLLGVITPYRMEVVQGNVVTQEMAAQLRSGMTRDQVRSLLGSPLLTDVFHVDRWDYVFSIRRQGTTPQQRRVTILFDKDRVVSFEAAQLPSEREFVDSIDAGQVERKSRALALSDDQLRALPLPAPSKSAGTAPEAAASAPLRAYPPLEPLSR